MINILWPNHKITTTWLTPTKKIVFQIYAAKPFLLKQNRNKKNCCLFSNSVHTKSRIHHRTTHHNHVSYDQGLSKKITPGNEKKISGAAILIPGPFHLNLKFKLSTPVSPTYQTPPNSRHLLNYLQKPHFQSDKPWPRPSFWHFKSALFSLLLLPNTLSATPTFTLPKHKSLQNLPQHPNH